MMSCFFHFCQDFIRKYIPWFQKTCTALFAHVPEMMDCFLRTFMSYHFAQCEAFNVKTARCNCTHDVAILGSTMFGYGRAHCASINDRCSRRILGEMLGGTAKISILWFTFWILMSAVKSNWATLSWCWNDSGLKSIESWLGMQPRIFWRTEMSQCRILSDWTWLCKPVLAQLADSISECPWSYSR